MQDTSEIQLGDQNAPDDGKLHVKAGSYLSRDAMTRINEALTPVAGSDWRSMQLVLDLADTTFLDSAGISALLSLRAQMERQSGKLRFCRVPPQLEHMFDIIGMSRLIPTVDSPRKVVEEVAP